MRVRFALTLCLALIAGALAGPVGAQGPVTETDPALNGSSIHIGRPRAAVLTVFHGAAESFLLHAGAREDDPLRLAAGQATLRLHADYEALFLPLTAGRASYRLEAWRTTGGERQLLAEDDAEVVAFGPARRAGRLGLVFELRPGLHRIELVGISQARPVGVGEPTTDRDSVTVWVLVPEKGDLADPPAPVLPDQGSRPIGDPDPSQLPVGGLGVGAQRAVVGDTAAGALNFETGHDTTITVRVGHEVRIWSDYELWWSEGAAGGAGAALTVSHRPTASGAELAPLARDDHAVERAEGPRLEDGSLVATFAFERPGTFPLVATLRTHARRGDMVSVDEDVVPFTVRVIDIQPVTGAITGAVAGVDGLALEGVTVVATTANGQPVGRGQTNAAGRYLIDGLDPGQVLVRALPGDLNYLAEWYDDSPSMAGADPVTVRSGQTTTGIDFALTPGGTITGRVTDEAGNGLGGIEIAVGRLRPDIEPGRPVEPVDTDQTALRTRTNDEGVYAIDRLAAGRYWVRASDPQGRYRSEYFDDRPTMGQADPVAVAAGKIASGIDFELSTGGVIAGRVLEQTALTVIIPLPGMTVEALSPEDPTHVVGRAVTNREGSYRIGSLDSGRYLVRASDPNGRFVAEWYHEAPSHEGAEPVMVYPGETTDGVNFTLERAAQVTQLLFEPTVTSLAPGGEGTLFVAVRAVRNLAAFQIELAWRPEVFEVRGVEITEFLGSTGRQVIPVEPIIDNAAGRLTVAAASVGHQDGPSGDGRLFAVRIAAREPGTSPIEVASSVLTDPGGREIAHEAGRGTVRVAECMVGDFDCNCVIDIRDVMEVVRRWGAVEGDPDYDPRFDMDDDGDIDIVDVQIEAGLWGQTCDRDPERPGGGMPAASAEAVAPVTGPETLLGAGLVLVPEPAAAQVGQTIAVRVDITEAVDLAGFELSLGYDPARLRLTGAELGTFLESTGRAAMPLGPTGDGGEATFGALSFSGPPAPTGTGHLATLTFEVLSAGGARLDVVRATTVSSTGADAPASGIGATIDTFDVRVDDPVFVPFAAQRTR